MTAAMPCPTNSLRADPARLSRDRTSVRKPHLRQTVSATENNKSPRSPYRFGVGHPLHMLIRDVEVDSEGHSRGKVVRIRHSSGVRRRLNSPKSRPYES